MLVSRNQAWTRGIRASDALLDLSAGTGLPDGTSVSAGLVEAAQRHGLVGMLVDHTDDPLTLAVFARESIRASLLVRHLNRVLNRLHDAHVRTAVLKGPAVAAHYSRKYHRPFSDLDLLIPESELEKALEVLEDDEAAIRVPAKRPKADKRDILFRDPSGVRFNVDLHWDLFSYSQLRGAAEGVTELAWSRAEPRSDALLGPLWEIPETQRVAFLAAHAVLDHRFRLILLRDFFELAREGVDWAALESAVSRWGLRSTTFLALWMSKTAIKAPIPGDFLESVRPRSMPLSYLQWALPRTDLVHFDGHAMHPINLAAVLLNDSPSARVSLLLRAPAAIPRWRRRVVGEAPARDHPRTLIVVSTDRRRGAEVFTERLRDGLIERGWVVEAVALRGAGGLPRARVDALVEESEVSRRRLDRVVMRALRAKIRSLSPDLIVANGGATLRYGVAAKIGLGSRLVYVGIGEPHYWIRSRWSRWANRLLLRATDRILAVSERTRAQLIELEPRIAAKIDVAHTGVPDALFRIEPTEPVGPLRVLMVGSLTEEKDPVTALRAVAGVDDCHLRFVGDGPLLDDLRSEAELLGIADRVEFTGSVVDVNPHLEWAHLLILTSLSEGLPGAVLEAGAASVPTVTLDVGGVREAVVDGESGVVVEDPRKLMGAIRALDEDRDRLRKMGLAARQHVRSRFSLDVVVDRYAQFLIESWR